MKQATQSVTEEEKQMDQVNGNKSLADERSESPLDALASSYKAGTWTVRDDPANYESLIHTDEDGGEWVARVMISPDRDARARLIASAPLLLEALKAALPTCDFVVDRDKGTDCGSLAAWVGSFHFRYCDAHRAERLATGRGEMQFDEVAAQGIAAITSAEGK